MSLVAVGCGGTAPLPPPVVIPFETKMSWILRLEDQRILRDASAPVAPPPIVKPPAKGEVVPPPPPPPPDLVLLLNDTEARTRRRAAIAIGRVGLPEGVPALVKVMQADADPEVRQMAAFALGLIGDQSAVEPLRAALADPLPLVAGRAAEALGLIGDTASAPAISKMIVANTAAVAAVPADDSRTASDPAAEAWKLGVYALTRLKSYDSLATSLLGADGQPRSLWWPVAYAFQRIEDKRSLPVLLTLARVNSAYTRAFALKGLGALGDESAVPVILESIDAAHATSGVTIEAIRAIGRIGDERGEPVLTKLLYTRGLNPMARAETLLALGESDGPVSVDAFVDFMGDPLAERAARGAAGICEARR